MDEAILLLGANGQVGHECVEWLRPLGRMVAVTRKELDLTDAGKIRDLVRSVQPRWIVNAAAYTAVDAAESDARTAFAVNGDAPGILGEEAARIGAPVIHLSTDYVFSGAGDRPWVETDATGPLNVYGASKLAGERSLADSGAGHFIFRTSWVFGSHGANFLLRILQLAQEREELKIVSDQYGAPTWAGNLAEVVAHSIRTIEADAEKHDRSLRESMERLGGIYHACSAGATSWFGFATEFLQIAREGWPDREMARLRPIPSDEYPTPAARPLNSRMDCEKLSERLGMQLPTWQNATARVMKEVLLRTI